MIDLSSLCLREHESFNGNMMTLIVNHSPKSNLDIKKTKIMKYIHKVKLYKKKMQTILPQSPNLDIV